MPDKHLSTQFDTELTSVSSRVMEMGGLVESQIRRAIYALSQFSVEASNEVSANEARVNAMEIEIDQLLSSIIARRQPTARDLRLLIAISKTTANLERVGDEAAKMARMVRSIIHSGAPRSLPSLELRVAADLASGLLNKALDAFARLDVNAAVSILKEDDLIDAEFDAAMKRSANSAKAWSRDMRSVGDQAQRLLALLGLECQVEPALLLLLLHLHLVFLGLHLQLSLGLSDVELEQIGRAHV